MFRLLEKSIKFRRDDDSTRYWYEDNLYHRDDDGPAIESIGCKMWCKHDAVILVKKDYEH